MKVNLLLSETESCCGNQAARFDFRQHFCSFHSGGNQQSISGNKDAWWEAVNSGLNIYSMISVTDYLNQMLMM